MPQIHVAGRRYALRYPVPFMTVGEGARICAGKSSRWCWQITVCCQESRLAIGEARLLRTPHPTVAEVVLAALLGGLILNLMPCVVTGSGHEAGLYFAGRGKSRRQIRRQFTRIGSRNTGLVYGSGAIDDGAAFNQSGPWLGIQFQNPWFHWRHGASDADVQRQPVRAV